jgi:CRP-like cAMP-binding protein
MTDMADPMPLNLKIELIKQQACFTKLTDKEAEELAGLLVEKHYNAGDIIVKQGAHVDSVFLIVRGQADVQVATVKEGELIVTSVATLGVGKSIGLNDTGFYSLTGTRTATVVAITDMMLLYLSVAAFHGFSLVNAHVAELMRKNAEDILGS